MTDARNVKVGPKGQVVIPKAIREELGIEPGQHVRVERAADEVRVRRTPSERVLDELQGIFATEPGSGTADLEAQRRAERELERRKLRRWSG